MILDVAGISSLRHAKMRQILYVDSWGSLAVTKYHHEA
jgi:hypothetical protein